MKIFFVGVGPQVGELLGLWLRVINCSLHLEQFAQVLFVLIVVTIEHYEIDTGMDLTYEKI